MGLTIGIDIGGTRLKGGVVDPSGHVLEESVAWMEAGDHQCDRLISRLESLVRPWLETHGPLSVGVGIPGVVEQEKGIVKTAPNFPDFIDFPVREVLTKRLGVPVFIDNDAHCVLAGECAHGAAKGVENALGFTLGTGVGGALLLGGKLWRGMDGMAGELGHLVVDPEGPNCNCGGRGCLEQYACRVGLSRLCKELEVPGVHPEDPDLPRLLHDAARAGNKEAQECFHVAGSALGGVIGGLLNTLNLHTVVLAGGVVAAYDWMEEGIKSRMAATSYPQLHENVDILCGTLGSRAGIVGAAHLARD